MSNTWKPRLLCAALVGTLAVIGCFDFGGAQQRCLDEERCEPKPCIKSEEIDLPDDDFQDTNCDDVDGDFTTAIFVDPVSGRDDGLGERQSPVKTIKRALELLRSDAGSGKTALYLAQGVYSEEQLTLDRPVSLYGAYGGASENWRRKSQYTTYLDGGTIGLTVSGLGQASNVRLEWLTINSANATAPGAASIALRVLGTNELRLHHTILAAGQGAPGLRGANGDGGTDGPDGGPGNNAIGATAGSGGGAPMHLCGEGNHSGGSGRTGAKFNPGGAGVTGQPLNDGGGPGGDGGVLGERVPQGSNAFYCEAGHGQDGWPGVSGTAGNAGPGGSGLGEVRGGTWMSTPQGHGGAGTPGTPGAGGGGGGSGGGCPEGDLPGPVTNESAGGGGSGAGGGGGCGGQEGQGGGPGGSSIALLLIDSSVQLEQEVTLSTRGGGPGGAGGEGGSGGRGGAGGLGGDGGAIESGARWLTKNYQSYGGNGGAGGQGGSGGSGGPGGGGAGGSSVGVWCSDGGVFAADSSTITRTLKAPGTGGASSGTPGTDGMEIPYHLCNPSLP